MRTPLNKKQWSLLVILVLVAALSVSPLIDQKASEHYDSLFQRALVTFALARTLNGVISAVQGTELALQPAGVGVTLTPGQMLDPVNDLVERFSWIMLGATISLGIQQVLLELSAWWILQGIVVVLAGWTVMLVLGKGGGGQRSLVMRALTIALFLRFAVPLTMIANDALYKWFLEPRYVASTEVISTAGDQLEALDEQEPPPVEEEDGLFGIGLLGTVGVAWSNATAGLDLGEKVDLIQERAAEMIEHLIQLSVVFILQTGIFPIAFLWLFLQLAKWLFRPLSQQISDK